MKQFGRKLIDQTILLSCHILYYPYSWFYSFSKNKSKKLHVGCGKNRFKGWINADIHPKADMIIFVQKRLPFDDCCLEKIYSEHVIEHVSYKEGVFFLKEAYRTLKPGGVIRIAMPDLDDLIEGYQKDWKRFDWVNWPEYSFIKTRAQMINIAFRWWGHRHLYNREELLRALNEAGFTHCNLVKWGISKFDELCGLETRLDSALIVEAVKS